MSKCSQQCKESIPLTLQQGYQFNQNQVKIYSDAKKGKHNKKILLNKIHSANREDYREIGYPNVGVGLLEKINFYELIDGSTTFRENFQNASNSDPSILKKTLPVTKDVIQSYFSELSTLDTQFNSVLEQYNTAQTTYTNELNNYIQKSNEVSSYQNKNISLSDGRQYYVNSKNVAKAFPSNTAYTNTQGKYNCPSGITNIGVNNLPSNLTLGANMNSGQSCGNEGVNIYVNKVNNNPQTSYIGCYKDSSTTPTMTSLSNGNAIYDYDTCMKVAADNNSPYFALENMNPATGLAKCNIGTNLSSIQQYGIAYDVVSNSVWTTSTQGSGPNTMVLKNDGNLVVLNNSTQEVVWSSNTPDSGCANGGMIQPNSFSGTYGINCNSKGYNVQANNASDVLNKNFGSTPKTTWSLGINNGVYGDPAGGCYKDFTASYKCGDNTLSVTGGEGGTAIFDCSKNANTCFFYILLNDNGNLSLFKGTPGSNGTNSYWSSNSITGNTRANPEWTSQKGKYGVNYIKSEQSLSPGEWVGSPSGTAKLMMDTDGALRVYVSALSQTANCIKTSSGKMIGNSNSNSVYSLVNNGVISNVGKTGYVNSNTQIQEYPNSMLSYGDKYDNVVGFDSIGDTLPDGIFPNSTVESCQEKCNAIENCAGFVFDTSSNVGELKTKIFPNTKREPNMNKNIYSRKIKITNSNSCTDKVVNVDSVLWNNYPAAANVMTPTTSCGVTNELEIDQNKVNELKEQLNNISTKIVTIVKKMTSMNLDINQKMDVNNKSLDDYIRKYKTTNLQIKKDLKVDVVNRNAILSDKNIYVLEENYKYMLWSTLAIAGIILTMNIVRST